ncbi:MAG TPA: Yip1 family protein [Blastocatellia bacterium]|nr:Yip1 family protein [Blastocatellia bacterium]
MSQPEQGMPQPPVPDYGATPVYHQEQVEEPARLGPFERLVGVLFSPGETFNDINRKPTWLVPMLIGVVTAIVFAIFLNWKLDAGWDKMMRDAMSQQGQGTPPTAEQLAGAKVVGKAFFVAWFGVVTVLSYLIVAGAFALGMMLLGAQTTFKKILSVVAWSFSSVGIVSLIVTVASLMLRDSESLAQLNPQNLDSLTATNLGALLPDDTGKFIKSLANSLDIFSFWLIALMSVGLVAIGGKRSIKVGSTATLVIGLWVFYIVVKAALTAAFAP